MSFKTVLGNAAVATAGVAQSAAIGYATQFNEPYSVVGLIVPNWIGAMLYILFLVIGSIFGANQQTPVDGKFKKAWLKPIYSLVFGVSMTLFVMPLIYPNITIWGLILPALFFASIGAVAIYFIIAFFTSEKLWTLIDTWAHGGAGAVLAEITRRGKNAFNAIFGGGK